MNIDIYNIEISQKYFLGLFGSEYSGPIVAEQSRLHLLTDGRILIMSTVGVLLCQYIVGHETACQLLLCTHIHRFNCFLFTIVIHSIYISISISISISITGTVDDLVQYCALVLAIMVHEDIQTVLLNLLYTLIVVTFIVNVMSDFNMIIILMIKILYRFICYMTNFYLVHLLLLYIFIPRCNILIIIIVILIIIIIIMNVVNIVDIFSNLLRLLLLDGLLPAADDLAQLGISQFRYCLRVMGHTWGYYWHITTTMLMLMLISRVGLLY